MYVVFYIEQLSTPKPQWVSYTHFITTHSGRHCGHKDSPQSSIEQSFSLLITFKQMKHCQDSETECRKSSCAILSGVHTSNELQWLLYKLRDSKTVLWSICRIKWCTVIKKTIEKEEQFVIAGTTVCMSYFVDTLWLSDHGLELLQPTLQQLKLSPLLCM